VRCSTSPRHLDWHGGFEAYAAAKARALEGRVAVVGLDDAPATALLPAAGATVKVGFRLGEPGAGELGVRNGCSSTGVAEDLELAPWRRFPSRVQSACSTRWVLPRWRAPSGRRGFRGVGTGRLPGGQAPRRAVAVVDEVTYVDDSKATNPHAAQASVLAYPRVVWVAGGLLKGASVDDMVARVADRLVGAVLIGRDRAVVAKALSRHAPDVPVIEVVTGEDREVHGTNESDVAHETRVVDDSGSGLGARVMTEVVAAAATLARPGDTVLLAPAGASFDQFAGYGDRGDAFAAAVRAAAR